jgi:hypothetical protein
MVCFDYCDARLTYFSLMFLTLIVLQGSLLVITSCLDYFLRLSDHPDCSTFLFDFQLLCQQVFQFSNLHKVTHVYSQEIHAYRLFSLPS